jgi:spectinomycin phosphotransferase
LLEHWEQVVTRIQFISIGDSAYSYRVETRSGTSYYLKIADRRTAVGRKTAAHMEFSLPLQRLVAGLSLVGISAPQPLTTVQGALYAEHDTLFFALYTFVHGDTLADAYPMSPELVQRIGQGLATLHTVQIPRELQSRSPQDSLTAPFDEELLANVASLANISARDAPYLQRLRELVWPRREQIRAFQAHSQNYAAKARLIAVPAVVCHGDAWGGNLILAPSGQLTLIDWEASVMAPPERDAFIYMGYLGPDFSVFDTGYRMLRDEPVRWHHELLAYYSYRLQLRNLSTWLHNLLHESLDEVQRENDLSMLGFHCLDRLELVERAVASQSMGGN